MAIHYFFASTLGHNSSKETLIKFLEFAFDALNGAALNKGSIRASHPADPGSIFSMPKICSFLMVLTFIDGPTLSEADRCIIMLI